MDIVRFVGSYLKRSSGKKHKARRVRLMVDNLDDRIVPSVNPIVTENQLAGNPQSEWDVPGDGDSTIQGFTTDFSVDQGQTVYFKVNDTSSALYHIDIYRIGYYGGAGARKVATLPSSQVLRQVQPTPLTDLTTGLVDAGNWAVSASWAVPSTATSGVYVAKLVREDTGGASHIYFIVRDDDGQSDLIVQTADTTWQAYNYWGGYSLYGAPTGGSSANPNSLSRAYAVSYNRPITLRGLQGGNGSYNSFFHSEYPMIRWLEANGYNASYTSDIDSDRRGAELLEHKVFISMGHDEYWSAGQRANVEAARAAGVNLAFFSGNEVYWKTRWANSLDASNTPYRTLVSYKESKANAKIDPSSTWTGTWRDMRFSPPYDGGNPENSLTGTAYMADRTSNDIGIALQVPEADGKLWFWRGTAVSNLGVGQVATIGDRVVGYETDEDLDNGFRPAGLMTLSSTTFSSPSIVNVPWGSTVGPGTSTHKMTLYRAQSGALVFGAGTIQWSWGLDGSHDNVASTPDQSIRQATVNLFADMGVQPATIQIGLVTASPSTDLVRPTSTITSPSNGASLQTGSTITITGTASDSGGGIVAGIEVSTDGGSTWRKATGRGNWSYVWTPSSPGSAMIRTRAVDDRGNVEMVGPGLLVNVAAVATSTTGLVAAYGLNAGSGSTVADSAGTNNGTISGATWTSGGMFGTSALSFNGTNAWVTVPDANALDLTSALTMEAWVKPTAATHYGTVLFKERPGGDAFALYAVNDASHPPAAYINTSVGGEHDLEGTTQLTLNTWSHLAVTYNGALMSLYVNGNVVSSTAVDGAITTSNGVLRIGGNSVFGDYFQGLIDEIRVYNRALNLGEIRSDMSTPVGGTVETTAPTAAVTTAAGIVSGVATVGSTASDNVLLAGVQLLVNGNPVGSEDTTAPFDFSWNTVGYVNGTYNVSVRARDFAGNVTTSNAVALTVSNSPETTVPTVMLTGLIPGTVLSGTTILSAVASDNIGVVGVQFKYNGQNIGNEVMAPPYQLAWNTTGMASGTYTVTAVARDAAGNTTTSTGILVTVDATAPTIASRTPAVGATGVLTDASPTVTFSEAIDPTSLSFILKDDGGNPLAAIVMYNSITNTATLSHPSALSTSATYTLTVSGAKDLAGNTMSGPVTWSFTTDSHLTGATIWGDTGTPAVSAFNDGSPQELGFKFTSSVAGFVTGVRFYKGVGNSGTHVGHLWAADGTLLASATFVDETFSGWQEVTFSTPVAITANTTYVASYYAPNGRYAFTSAFFASSVNSYPLRALSSAESGGNGVFRGGAGGGFPSQSFNSANYWVDVLFDGTAADTAAPTVSSQTPSAGMVGAAIGGSVTATFSEPVQANTIAFALRDSGGNLVPTSFAYNDTTWTATLTPTATLTNSATYSVTLSGAKDAGGNTMTANNWTFSTAAPVTGGSIWGSGGTPATPAFNEAAPLELGFKFRSSLGGYVTGVRFYKGLGNSGTHIGHLWTSNGTLLATATFVNETVSGWQDVSFSTPVAISANTTYVASYYAPNGHYAFTSGFFANGVDTAPLRALSSAESGGNGVFFGGIGGGFPNQSYNSANYWVDVLFNADAQDTTGPAVSTQTPASGATAVPVASPVTATFAEPVQANSIAFVLRDAGGNIVPSSLSYDAPTNTATLTPSANLSLNAIYTATVSAATDLAGNPMMVPVSWSFTTPSPVTNATLWAGSATPAIASVNEAGPNELGFKFYSDVAGTINGIRYYRGTGNNGTHVGKLYSANGTLLASATFTNESSTGWQQVFFSSPVFISPNTLYIASYYTPTGFYSVTNDYFVTSVDSGALHAPADGANGSNGLYKAGGGFPTSTYRSNNYWVDVLFSQGSSDNTAPLISAVTPASGATGVLTSSPITFTFNEAVLANTISLVVKDSFNVTVAGNMSYNGSTKTATFTPATSLLPMMNYTVTVSGAKDLSGNTMAGSPTWTFRTLGMWTQSTFDDFNAGTNDGTIVTNNAGGEIQLAPLLQEEFSGGGLNPSSWTTTSWTPMGGGATSVSVSTDTLALGGAGISTVQSYTNTAVEGRVNFGTATYQHFGLATGLNTASGNYWAMFSTRDSTSQLYARVNTNGSSNDVNLGTLPSGYHTYRVEPTATGYKFYIDGVLETTINASFTASQPLKATLSAFSATPIQADWIRFNSYSTTQTGKFVSSVFDAGSLVDWDVVTMTADLPAATGIVIETMTSLDGINWTAWSQVNNGTNTSANGRFIRYRATLSTTNGSATPVLKDISFTWK